MPESWQCAFCGMPACDCPVGLYRAENERLRAFYEAWDSLPYWWHQPPPLAHRAEGETQALNEFRRLDREMRSFLAAIDEAAPETDEGAH